MRRAIALLLLIVAVVLTTLLRTSVDWPKRGRHVEIVELPLPSRAEQAAHLGAFTLDHVWELRTTAPWASGFSSLIALPGGDLLTFSDRGAWFRFRAPVSTRSGRSANTVLTSPIHGSVYQPETAPDRYSDIESATRDPVSGTIWIAQESTNLIARLDARLRPQRIVRPRAMAGWDDNSGPETMVRLKDGRFLILREVDAGYACDTPNGLLYHGPPDAHGRHGATKPTSFCFAGPPAFRPTDAAQLPDGRVLVLMRRLLWPLPLRFAGRIAIGDPAQIRPDGTWHLKEVARLSSTLPVDNMEGMAIVPESGKPGGRVSVWLISDDNNSATQRIVLWKLTVDPAKL